MGQEILKPSFHQVHLLFFAILCEVVVRYELVRYLVHVRHKQIAETVSEMAVLIRNMEKARIDGGVLQEYTII